MKAHLVNTSTINAAVLAALFTIAASSARAQVPPSSTLGIAPTNGGIVASVKFNDAGNHVWLLQSSSNFVNWTEVESLKVHNGSFQRRFAADVTKPQFFFRTVYDPARQDILSTTTNALLLPAT